MELKIIENKIYKIENVNIESQTEISSKELESFINDATLQIEYLHKFIEENRILLEQVLKLESELKLDIL
jgi:hypothetical protein